MGISPYFKGAGPPAKPLVSQSGSLPSPKAKLWCGIWVIENKGI